MPATPLSVGARLRRLVKSPWLQVLVGIGMVVSALSEVVGPWLGVEEGGLTAGHGLLLYGVVHVAKALAEAWEGVEKVRGSLQTEEREAAKASAG